jgi:RNA polymerase sigma factor (sigma-70 family)
MTTSPYYAQQNDQALWTKLCQGDREAFGEIYQRYFSMLFRYCIRFTADRNLVKDMLQDFFSQLYLQREGLSLPSNLKSYLIVSARRKLFRYLDKAALSTHLDEGAATLFTLELSPEHALINRQHAERTSKVLQQRIDALTPRQKEAVYLRFYENLSYEDIAGIMEMKEIKYARTLIYRALAELKELLMQDESALLFR